MGLYPERVSGCWQTVNSKVFADFIKWTKIVRNNVGRSLNASVDISF